MTSGPGPMTSTQPSEGVGWRGWPESAVQLAALARGLVDLKRAASLPYGWAAVVDLDGVSAIVELILKQKGMACHSLSG